MSKLITGLLTMTLFLLFAGYGHCLGQNTSSSLNGEVKDEKEAAIPNAAVALRNVDTGIVLDAVADASGFYNFLNLPAANYELKITANGFQTYIQSGMRIALNEKARVDIQMKVGSITETLEVRAEAPQLNFEDATQSGSLEPKTVNELPLIVAGGPRSAASFATLLPGVTAPDGDIIGARINGGVRYSGEAVLNGVSLVNPSGGNGTWSAAFDFPQSPDMVSELKVLTSNYEPQYGSTGGAIFILETKAGTNQFHGGAYEYHRNTVLNANQFGIGDGRPGRPKNLQNNFGGAVGGPVKLPLAWSSKNKTFFFANWEGYRIRGGLVRQVLSIPSLKEREGDFSDWVDASGNLIPIYDPATTRVVGGQVVRDQFMGCDGKTPNVICKTDPRLQSALASQWFKFLPPPTSSGARFNYSPPAVPGGISSDANILNLRFDEYIGEKEHFTVTIYKRDNLRQETTLLPPQLSTDQVNYKHTWINRLSWDHTFTPSLLNHFSGGYNDDHFFGGGIDVPYTDQLPQIKGVARHAYPSNIGFSDDFAAYGSNTGSAEENSWPAPAVVVSDLVTWVSGRHTFKFGAEFRHLTNNVPRVSGEAGQFIFSRLSTGLRDVNSGSPIASFLLGQVDSGSFSIRTTTRSISIQTAAVAHFGDTWRLNQKMSLNYGLRWDTVSPSVEKHDFSSFLDPYGANPTAGNRPGRLAFASSKANTASFGRRYPEERFYKAFAPRVGLAYAPRDTTVFRLGYGIFYDSGFYPGWEGGIAQDGFNASPSFSSLQGGLVAAFNLNDGVPQNTLQPPFLEAGFLNGQNAPLYRPIDANRLPYTQQWNLTVEQQATKKLTVSAAYVGSKGTRLISRLNPLNALDPKLLKQYGARLFDEFQPGQTSLDGVNAPYTGWASQMQACAPSVAQALLPYPQYCGNIYGLNENAGNSTYHSMQLKAEDRFSQGLWFLASYTFSKLITNAESNQPGTLGTSPFEQNRSKGLSRDDVPHTLSFALTYDLPFGKGERWINRGGVLNQIIGGWRISNILRLSSGTPFAFRSGFCNVPSQFALSCLPGVLPGADPFAQSKSSFDPSRPLFNISAFEPLSNFESTSYYGSGSRITNLRGFGYKNQDFSIFKDVRLSESVTVQLRGEVFNLWNSHTFRGFDTNIASPNFGMWNGAVTNPRNIQVAARLTF